MSSPLGIVLAVSAIPAIWVCAEDGRLVRADQVGWLYVTGSSWYSPEAAPQPDAEVMICTDLLGGTDGEFLTRCTLAKCGGSAAQGVIVGLAAAIVAAGRQPEPAFVFLDVSGQQPSW